MSIKSILKNSKTIMNLYHKHQKKKMEKLCKDKYVFEGAKKDSEKLCYILSGYKPFLWDIIFARIKAFIPDDYDVCIVSSGLYSDKLSTIARENNWCYLSTKTNNVALVQNVTISHFKKANYFFKLDEDIFVTDHYFDNLIHLYTYLKKESSFDVGVVAPMIPINGFAHALVLERYHLTKDYENKFERVLQKAGGDRMIENNPEAAKYMWGENSSVPNIDKIATDLNNDSFSFVPVPVKFSIGAILFDRSMWETIGYFKFPSKKAPFMGGDESQICSECVLQGRPFIVSKNAVVGHLSFGKQNQAMKDFYLTHPEIFALHLESKQ